MLSQSESRTDMVVIATHDLQLVAAWADRVIVLGPDGVLADAAPERIFETPEILRQAHLQPPQVVEISDQLGVNPLALTVDDFVGAMPTPEGNR